MENVLMLLSGLCTFNEGFWLAKLLDYVLDCDDNDSAERKFTYRHLTWILTIIYFLIFIIFGRVESLSQYALIIAILAVAILVYSFYNCEFVSLLSIIGCYEFVLFMLKLIHVSLFALFGGAEMVMSIENGTLFPRVLFLILTGSIWFVASFVYMRYVGSKEIKYSTQNIKNINIIGFVGLTFLLIRMFVSMRVHMDTFMFIIVTTFGVCIVSIHVYTKYKMMIQQLRVIENRNDLLIKNYENINESYASQAKFNHDMRRHLRMIRRMLENNEIEDALKYIDSLGEATEVNKKKVFTGVDIIDIILSEKKKAVKSLGKAMTINASLLPNNLGIEMKDMCIVFANLLDNALECADKDIVVTIKPIHKMLLFKIENDYIVEPKKKNGIYLTSKKDKIYHGWGIKSVETVVSRYEGHMDYKIVDGKFSVDIILNMT